MPRLNPFAMGRTKLTKLWEVAIDGHVISLAWSASLDLIAAASMDGPIALFDAKTGQLRFNLLGHGFGTACVAWSADGQQLASAGQDGKVRLWDPATGRQTMEMPGGAPWVERVAWCPTANLLASAAGKKLRLWNPDGTMLHEYGDHSSTIADIQWKPNDAILASTGYGKLYLWDCLPSPPGRGAGGEGDAPVDSSIAGEESAESDSATESAAPSPPAPLPAGEGRKTPSPPAPLPAGEGRKAAPLSGGKGGPLREFAWQGSMLALAWSPNAEYIAAGGQDCSVHFWLLRTGEDLQMSGYPVKVRELAWDARSRFLATGGGTVPCVWDCSGKGPAGTQPLQLDAHQDNVTCLVFQHQGALLASGGEDGLVALWQPGKQLGTVALAKLAEPVSQLLWSADDRCIAVGTAQGGVLFFTT